ncbi:MAG: hypothetical protein R3F59_15005 [Myxococcota bacterium]
MNPIVRKLTPVVVVDAIEPALPTWRALGYEPVAEVPHGDALGFVLLAGPAGELMLQTRDSVREDLGVEPPAVALYADVSDLDAAAAAVSDAEVVIARRTTPYGATERWIRDGAGTLVGFAVHG